MNAIPIREDLKLASVLAVLGGLATAALFPYLMAVMPESLAKVPASVPLWLVIVFQSLQSVVLLGVLAFCGLRMGHHVGLGAPWLRAVLSGRERSRQAWLAAMALGAFAGVLMVGIEPLFAPYMPAPLHAQPPVTAQASAFAGFLASFYGGIGEEVELRLFLMTLIAWALSALSAGRTRALHFYIAIVLAALLFGALHLPAAAHIWPLDAIVVTRVILLNALAGLVFGWLYWKQGLESAMLAHFSADLVLHVLTPLAAG